MKKLLTTLPCLLWLSLLSAQKYTNTSYTTSSGEKVLRFEIDLPADMKTCWHYFSTDEGIVQWMAPAGHIDLRTGGSIVTNYDKTKPLSDPSSIHLDILNYLEGELLTLKVHLNDHFPAQARAEDKNLQEVIQLKPVNDHETKVISSMIGWGTGAHWDSTYRFFEKGNAWTCQEIVNVFKK